MLAYEPDVLDLFGRAAGYVDHILKGAEPADLPVERTTDALRAGGQLQDRQNARPRVPPSMLACADELIE
jgi:putative ABC transport system substrate-binding protein